MIELGEKQIIGYTAR